MQLVAVDILGPLPQSEAGNSYILVAGDYFTRWMEAYPIPNQEATTVAKKLVDNMFCRFSTPEQIHSDQGRQFEAKLLQELCRQLHIKKTRTTPYHPQSDGLVERFNRTLLDMLSTGLADDSNHSDWESHLPKVCLAYNTSVQSTTGYTPFYLMFGRQARLPVDIMYGLPKQEETNCSSYAARVRDALYKAYDRVRSRMSGQLQRQKELYDKKIHGEPFEPNSLVWLHSTAVKRGTPRKLHLPWKGPFRVVKKLSDVTYRIQDVLNKRRRLVVHFDRLKPYLSSLTETAPRDLQESPQEQQRSHPVGHNLELLDGDNPPAPGPLPILHPPPMPPPPPTSQSVPPPPPLPSQSMPPPTASSQSLPAPPRRYPQRTRRPPDRFAPYIEH